MFKSAVIWVFVCVISLFMGFMLLSNAKTETAENARIVAAADLVLPVIRVPYDYPTIQQAIDAALPGSTILVSSGTYSEHLLVNKTLNLLGEDKDSTVLDGGGDGIVMMVTADEVVVDGFKIMNGETGLNMSRSDNSTVSGNIMLSNYQGIFMVESNNNSLLANVVANNDYDSVGLSMGNTLSGNSIVNDRLEVIGGGSNTFHHNNFLNCDIMEQLYWSPNLWDENFWDSNIYREEHHPLAYPYGSVPIIWENVVYPVDLVSGSSVWGIGFTQTEKHIGFNIMPSPSGYCNITIPKSLLGGPWEIDVTYIVTNVQPEITINENETHTSIYFNYTGITPPYEPGNPIRVQVIGTSVIPEFPSSVILTISMILVMTQVISVRRFRRGRNLMGK